MYALRLWSALAPPSRVRLRSRIPPCLLTRVVRRSHLPRPAALSSPRPVLLTSFSPRAHRLPPSHVLVALPAPICALYHYLTLSLSATPTPYIPRPTSYLPHIALLTSPVPVHASHNASSIAYLPCLIDATKSYVG
ncbi:hypothetical protein C8Q80DRAFT_470286 [Daedaleopsis nitida]|nr:hypothetical protein C8Q80DRAFT_470286 [Daedaleopsis nitida]